MRELQRAARGESVVLGGTSDVPFHIMGMVSTVRSALKKVHLDSPSVGSARVHGKLDHHQVNASSSNRGHKATATAAQNYTDAVDRCAAWHTASPLKAIHWELKALVSFNSSDRVAAVVRVVLGDPGSGEIVGRILLWDPLPLDLAAAEIMAALAVEVLDQTYSPAQVREIEVWQCRLGDRHVVSAVDARAARASAAALVAGM